jgi:XTP/dITP diphosphohydrolase
LSPPEAKTLVLASNNPGKLREIRALLAGADFSVVAQGELGIPEAEEPHDSFVDNALAKARHASAAAGLPALADDSGLCVPSLGGDPGVHSAYYAGREGDRAHRDALNNAKLLASLAGKDRRAYYACVMTLVREAGDPRPIVAEGRWHGEIAQSPRGANGFGYDPLFYLPEQAKTAAELDPETKNRISHRGLALQALLKALREWK